MVFLLVPYVRILVVKHKKKSTEMINMIVKKHYVKRVCKEVGMLTS